MVPPLPGRTLPGARPSGTLVSVTGMPVTIQWTYVPPGASGSSTTIASSRASSGTPLQASGGETSSPPCRAHAYFPGIAAPSAKAGLLTFSAPEGGTLPDEHPARTTAKRTPPDSLPIFIRPG